MTAYTPSAVATPRAAAAPTRSEVRAVRLMMSAAMAPTGTATPYPASSPATNAPLTTRSASDRTGYRPLSTRAFRRSGRGRVAQAGVGHGDDSAVRPPPAAT